MKEPNKRKAAAAKPSKNITTTTVIKLDDLVAKPGVRGGGKTFFGGKQQ